MRVISSSRLQNRSTLASSSGASTSSSTHTGAGLQRNTAKISAMAVSACSPPESSDIVCSFLPGGRARISSPASSGSSDSVRVSRASPPLNKDVNSVWKFAFTRSKASRRRSRPSRLSDPIPCRRRAMASSRSAFSVCSEVRRASHSFASSSARRFTPPSCSRSRLSFSARCSAVSSEGRASPAG